MAELSALKPSVQAKSGAKPSSLGAIKIAEEKPAAAPVQNDNILQYIIYTLAAIMTIMWVGFCIAYAFGHDIPTDPASLGMYLTGVFSPPALFWMLITAIAKTGQGTSFATPPSTQASETALKSAAAISQKVKTDIRELNALSQKTEKRIALLSESLHQRSAVLRDLITEIETRSANIDQNSQRGIESWDNATLHILERAAEIENTILNGAEKITAATDTAESQISNIGDHLHESFEALNLAANQINTRLKSINTGFKAGTKNITLSTNELEKQAAQLETTTKQNVNSMIHTTSLLRDYGDKLDDDMRSLTTQADYISETLGASMIRIEDALDDVTQTTSTSEDFAKNYADKHINLLQTADLVIEESLTNLTTTSKSIAEDISTEILSAAKAAQDMLAQAPQRSSPEPEFSQETFPKIPPAIAPPLEKISGDIEFIVEHLHSISMDIARIAEGGVSEQTWHLYQNGNIAAFTQRLQALPKILPLRKARKRYKEDTQFQTYTDRFIAEYDDMRKSVPMNAMIPLELETLYSYLRRIVQ